MKKNDEFVVAIEDMSEDGAGIGRVDGYIWFISWSTARRRNRRCWKLWP